MSTKLERAIFETSRELEYFSEKELCAQIGHDQSFWPVPILRELIDNALDAAELAGVPPVIEITTTTHAHSKFESPLESINPDWWMK